MKGIIFTLCSNNYLPQALLLGESFLKFNTGYLYIIGLVDKMDNQINYPETSLLRVVECEKVVPADILSKMSKLYKIVELNTFVKPFYFEFIFKNYSHVDKVIFFDPDIYFYHSINYVESLLDTHDIIVTPHCVTPLPLDGCKPSERSFLKYGVYNFGFLAVRRSEESFKFVNWFKDRMHYFCYAEIELGMYVDQLWSNLVPVFFNGVYITHHPGLNCAYWNLHERVISAHGGNYMVNDDMPLIFFHFSAIDVNKVDGISKSQNRYTLKTRPDLEHILTEYVLKLVQKRKEQNYNIPCIYTRRSLKDKLKYYKNRLDIRRKLWV
jgi:hypothetical protein